MSVAHAGASVLLALVLWALVKRLTATKARAIDIAGPETDHWLKGNYHRIFQDGLEYNLQLTEKYGGAVRIHALLGEEQLYVSDPRALHHIVVKEQDVYEETDMFIMGNKLIFGEGLISTLGEQHRKQRKMLNPVFSLANMRDLLPTIQPIADQLCDLLVSKITAGEQEIDIVPWTSRGALEYICQAALGYTFDALNPEKTSEYAEALRRFSPTALRLILIRPFVPFFVRNFSLQWRNRIMDWVPIKPLKEFRRIVEVMHRTCKGIYADKKSAIEGTLVDGSLKLNEPQGATGFRSRGRDIISILLRANRSSNVRDMLTESELLGQMNTIIFAGFETTAIATSRLLYLLASRPDAQARLRREVRAAKMAHVGDSARWQDVNLSYDVLMGLPYLDALVRETLRVYPPTSLLSRTTRKSTVLPLEFPVRSASGQEVTSIPLPENTTVIISILAANHNKEIWGEDASDWRPERWLTSTGERVRLSDGENPPDGYVVVERSEEEDKVPGNRNGIKYPGVYASMMTFLGGGRACIGFKFAEMEMKQVLTTLLSTLHFSLPAEKEIYWKMNGLQVPVVRPPAGDGQTPQVPLKIRLVRDDDY
uniref:Cytochrome P450 n=1 Tax=Rhodonia placenta TaxID=104341 RepID=F1SYG2_9APHY|nr:cytochrome P450 [Postia placenta]